MPAEHRQGAALGCGPGLAQISLKGNQFVENTGNFPIFFQGMSLRLNENTFFHQCMFKRSTVLAFTTIFGQEKIGLIQEATFQAKIIYVTEYIIAEGKESV